MKPIICIALAAALLASCAPARRIDYDYDKTVNFGKYRTFAWMPQAQAAYKDNRYQNEIIDNNIKTYVAKHFEAMGLKLDKRKPDLLLSYDLQVEKGEYTQEIPIYQQLAVGMMNPWMNGAQAIGWNHPMNFQFWGQPGMVVPGGMAMAPGMWMPPPQVVGYRTRQVPFKNGTLVVSAHTKYENRLIWRGWAVSCLMNPAEYKEELNEKTKELVDTYPLNKKRRG